MLITSCTWYVPSTMLIRGLGQKHGKRTPAMRGSVCDGGYGSPSPKEASLLPGGDTAGYFPRLATASAWLPLWPQSEHTCPLMNQADFESIHWLASLPQPHRAPILLGLTAHWAAVPQPPGSWSSATGPPWRGPHLGCFGPAGDALPWLSLPAYVHISWGLVSLETGHPPRC